MSQEENRVSSSQESVILSQETFLYLWNEIQQGNAIADDQLFGYETNLDSASHQNQDIPVEATEDISSLLQQTNVLSNLIQVPDSATDIAERQGGPSSLPASENWTGDYGFNVTFEIQEKLTKASSWTYSPVQEKLYVNREVPCPINISTSVNMPVGTTYIRAMVLFSSSKHASDVAHRCYTHSIPEMERGLPEAQHLIRCESDFATYEVDSYTKRCSVLVPFENPPVGQFYSTYIFTFPCFSSCSGGPNRRPLMVVFTLENGVQVLGRKKIDLKVCACPFRDRENERSESEKNRTKETKTKKRKDAPTQDNLSNPFDFLKSTKMSAAKKPKNDSSKDESYSITVTDRKTYEFLKAMKAFYNMFQMLGTIGVTPNLNNKLLQLFVKTHLQKKDESE